MRLLFAVKPCQTIGSDLERHVYNRGTLLYLRNTYCMLQKYRPLLTCPRNYNDPQESTGRVRTGTSRGDDGEGGADPAE